MKIKSVLMLLLVFAVSAGCSAGQSAKRYCYEKGSLRANILQAKEEPCKVDFIYRNLAKHTQQPIIDIILYDQSDNFIKHEKLSFDKLASGQAQQLSENIECNGMSISKVYVRDGVNFDRCYGYKCSKLCGINGNSIDVYRY
jgi:hypothetical protein